MHHLAGGCVDGLSLHGNVGLLSSFPERLVNVYARLDNVAPTGFTLCPGVNDPNPGFPELAVNAGLVAYPQLDQGVNTFPASGLFWSFDLPSTADFTFHGTLQAEIMPPAPTNLRLNGAPANGATVSATATMRGEPEAPAEATAIVAA